MDISTIDEAIMEAKRFLKRAAAFKCRIKTDEQFSRFWHITGGKETAALKRSSLDLTRALSAMRRYT